MVQKRSGCHACISSLFKVCVLLPFVLFTRVYLLTLSDSCCWKTFIVLLSWKLTEVGEKSSDSLLHCKRVSCWFFWHERQTASTSTAFQEQTARNCAPPLPNLNYVPSVFSLKATWRDIHKHLSSQTHSTKFVMWPKLLIYYWQSEVFGQVGIFRSWSPCSLDTFTRTPAVHFLLLIQYMVIGWRKDGVQHGHVTSL